MNRSQRRLANKLKNNGNSPMPQLQTLSLPSLQELTNLDRISMEDLKNMPEELQELINQSTPTEQKPKRSYKKRTQNHLRDTSGLDEFSNDQAPKRPKQTAKQKRIADGICGLIGTVGAGLITASQVSGKPVLMQDGMAILNSALPIADNLVEVGKQYPKMMFALEKVVEGSAITGLIAALGGLGVTIAINHGVIKADALSGIFNLPQENMEAGTTFNN